ncbi:isoprenylcysteine carboxylmethyltransferase family protein [Candidatus Bathyarchaeota archaeon]|nr:isoprenylcysteine carboxylmethyltransferase family protein [Candidatus Bathyarchaeota archaeon]
MRKRIIHLIGHFIYVVLYCLLILFCILHYNSANLRIPLYSGRALLIFGALFLLWSSQSRREGRMKSGGEGEVFVESGPYTLVRHPEFLGHILIISALILMTQCWISLVMGLTLIGLLSSAMVMEERENIEKFGDAYRDYMERVPRINLPAGIIKRVIRRRRE